MKIKNIYRKSDVLHVKILNLPICQITFDNKTRKIKYFGGVLYIKENVLSLEKNIRFFGFSIFRKTNTDKLKYLALYKFLKRMNKKEKKHVFIFNGSPSGELYIVLNLMNKLMQDIPQQEILFVADKKFKIKLCKLWYPKIDCCLIKKLDLFINKQEHFKHKGVNFYSIFTTDHYLKQDELINKEGIHYYEYILQDLKIDNDAPLTLPQVSNQVQNKIKSYIKQKNISNLIIISPEANTCDQLSILFWQKLCDQLRNRKYDVFLNITKIENYIQDCYLNFFTHEELIELAKCSKGIIGLRSGLIEILSTVGVSIHCLYSPFPKRGKLKAMSSKKALSGFSLTKLPGVNKKFIYEYDTNKISEDKLLELIIEKFDGVAV
ncbi:MAG: hypothetical protein ACI4S3_02625 [Candidatus Gastranaerophilaceae bacterium]